MYRRRKKESISTVVVIALLGRTYVYLPPYVQLAVITAGLLFFIRGGIREMFSLIKTTPSETHIYIGGIGMTSLIFLYTLGGHYLHWQNETLYKILILGIIPGGYIVIASIIQRLRSGDPEQIRMVKFGLVIFGFCLVLMAYIAYDIITNRL